MLLLLFIVILKVAILNAASTSEYSVSGFKIINEAKGSKWLIFSYTNYTFRKKSINIFTNCHLAVSKLRNNKSLSGPFLFCFYALQLEYKCIQEIWFSHQEFRQRGGGNAEMKLFVISSMRAASATQITPHLLIATSPSHVMYGFGRMIYSSRGCAISAHYGLSYAVSTGLKKS